MSWKKQTDIAKKQYQGLLKFDRFDKGDDEEGKREPEFKKYKESYLVYNNNLAFTNIMILISLRRIESKYNKLDNFFLCLHKFNSLEPPEKRRK